MRIEDAIKSIRKGLEIHANLSASLACLFLVATLILAIFLVVHIGPENFTVAWEFDGHTMVINVKKDMTNPQTIIDKLMSNQYSRDWTLSYLQKENVYSITKPAVVKAIRGLCPDQPKGENLESRQQHLQPCHKSMVVRNLRSMASHHEGPFQYFGEVVTIGTPSGKQPHNGDAYVCKSGDFRGQKIEIDTLQGQRQIDVNATGYYQCTGYSNAPDIQISAHDAMKLFGTPTSKFEKAVAVIM